MLVVVTIENYIRIPISEVNVFRGGRGGKILQPLKMADVGKKKKAQYKRSRSASVSSYI